MATTLYFRDFFTTSGRADTHPTPRAVGSARCTHLGLGRGCPAPVWLGCSHCGWDGDPEAPAAATGASCPERQGDLEAIALARA